MYSYYIIILRTYVVFVAVAISFLQSSYFASEAQRFMNVTLVSSVPVDFPYSIAILTIQSTPVSAAGKNIRTKNAILKHCIVYVFATN